MRDSSHVSAPRRGEVFAPIGFLYENPQVFFGCFCSTLENRRNYVLGNSQCWTALPMHLTPNPFPLTFTYLCRISVGLCYNLGTCSYTTLVKLALLTFFVCCMVSLGKNSAFAVNGSLFVFVMFPLAEMPVVRRKSSPAKICVTGSFVYWYFCFQERWIGCVCVHTHLLCSDIITPVHSPVYLW